MEERLLRSCATGMPYLFYEGKQTAAGSTMVYLHGRSGFDYGIDGLFDYADLPALLRGGMTLDTNVLIPVCQGQDEWDPALVADFLADVDDQYHSSAIRYDLVGYSRGGTGGYRVAARVAARIRTLTVIAARPAFELVPQLSMPPILIVHGRADDVVPVLEAQRMHEALQQVNKHCSLLVLEGDHYIAEVAISDGRVTEWRRNATAW